jgi:CheY-like chemotaxis protein
MLEQSGGFVTRGAEVDSRSKLVVAADDTKENLLLEKAFLEAAGYRFIGVGSGAECIALVSRVKPRLIMLDIQMPEMDGIETCRRIRAIPDMRKVPIAFITVCKTAADVRAGMAAGGNDFIIKPFTRDRLIERVAYWTSRSAPSSLERAG